MTIGKVPHALTEGGQWSPILTAEQIGEDSATIKSAEATASAEAANQVAAQQEVSKAGPAQAAFEGMLNNPLFDAAVGPIEGRTSGMRAAMGSEAGELGKQISMMANNLLLDAAQKLTGPKSDEDIKMLRSTIPAPTDPADVWRNWYATVYLPTINESQSRASGGAPKTDPNVVDFSDIYGD